MTSSVAQVVPRLVSQPATAYSARRMDAIVGRMYATVAALSGIEIVTNALRERDYLHPVLFWLVLALNVGPIVTMVIGNWFFEVRRRWYILHAFAIAVSLMLWPLLPTSSLGIPVGMTPFIWWSMGWAGISAGLGFSRIIAAVYMTLLPVGFAILETTKFGGSASVNQAIQNAVYTFLISATLTGMVALLRWRAEQQDLASEYSKEVTAAEAAAKAVSDERLRLSAVVHTQVLTAINAAIDAYSPEQKQTAVRLAAAALDRLNRYDQEFTASSQTVSVSAFFEALQDLVRNQSDAISVSSSMKGNFELPMEVASALTEATVQAVTNSLVHAGGGTTQRKVSLRSVNDNIKVTIVDDGRGFRPSRVPKNRLGIQVLIFSRVQQVGGTSHINSKPGEGTTVIIEWRQPGGASE